MGCCHSKDEDDESIWCCNSAESRTMWQVIFDLVFYVTIGGLILVQLFLIAGRLDDFTFHDQYSIPSTASWYGTFWPTFALVAFLIVVFFIWINAIGKMRGEARRTCTLSLAVIVIYMAFVITTTMVMLCSNLNVFSHNYAARALRHHNVTAALPISAGSVPPLKLWEDDDIFVDVIIDPSQMRPYNYSWYTILMPSMLTAFLIILYGLFNWISQNSRKTNIATMCCNPQLGDEEFQASFFGISDDHSL